MDDSLATATLERNSVATVTMNKKRRKVAIFFITNEKFYGTSSGEVLVAKIYVSENVATKAFLAKNWTFSNA
jgi:hypothetical protein